MAAEIKIINPRIKPANSANYPIGHHRRYVLLDSDSAEPDKTDLALKTPPTVRGCLKLTLGEGSDFRFWNAEIRTSKNLTTIFVSGHYGIINFNDQPQIDSTPGVPFWGIGEDYPLMLNGRELAIVKHHPYPYGTHLENKPDCQVCKVYNLNQ